MEIASPTNSNRIRIIRFTIPLVLLVIGAIAWRPVKERIACRTNQPKYLIDAMNTLDLTKVKRYVQSGCNLNLSINQNSGKPISIMTMQEGYQIIDNEETPLIRAVSSARFELVKYLLAHGAKVNYSTRSGRTALHAAVCTLAGKAFVSILLDQGADINKVGAGGRTPLDCANINDAKLIAFMLDYHALTGGRKFTLEEARSIEMSSYKVSADAEAALAVDRNQTMNMQDSLCDLLNRAALSSAYATVKMLLDRGVNPNTPNRLNGQVPIMECITGPAKFLYRGDLERTPEYSDQTSKLVALLISRGADVKKAVDKEGLTALHHACIRHDAKLAKVLLEAGANPNAKDKKGRSPYSYLATVEDQIR